MYRPYRYLDVEQQGEVSCVRMRQSRLDETQIYEATAELIELVTDGGCRRMVLALGPERPECLYSVFLAKLVTLQRELTQRGGKLLLFDASPEVRSIFAACGLEDRFHFITNVDEVEVGAM